MYFRLAKRIVKSFTLRSQIVTIFDFYKSTTRKTRLNRLGSIGAFTLVWLYVAVGLNALSRSMSNSYIKINLLS